MPTEHRVDRDIALTASRFAERHVRPVAAGVDHADPRFPDEVFAHAVNAGFDRLAIPESAGGYGFDLAALCDVVRVVAQTCAGHAMAIGAHAAAMSAIVEVAGGAPEEVMTTGRPIGVAIPDPVPELYPLLELERAGDDGILLSGGPVTVVNASPSGFVLAFAKTGSGAPAAVLFEAGGELPLERTLGLRAMPIATLALDRRAAPPECVIAEGNWALELHKALVRNLCLVSAAAAAGLMGAAADKALAYAMERRQGGRLIVDHSHLRGILGRMSAGATAARGAAMQAAAEPGLVTALGTMAAVTRSALGVCTDAVQVLGGYGYMREYGLEKAMRDAAVLSLLPMSDAAAEQVIAAQEKQRLE